MTTVTIQGWSSRRATSVELPPEYEGFYKEGEVLASGMSFAAGSFNAPIGEGQCWSGPYVDEYPACCGAGVLSEFPFEHSSRLAKKVVAEAQAAFNLWWRLNTIKNKRPSKSAMQYTCILNTAQAAVFRPVLEEKGWKQLGPSWTNVNTGRTLTMFVYFTTHERLEDL